MLTAGLKHTKSITVDDARTAKHVGSGELAVLATPVLIALMEATAMESILDALEEGQTTVGTAIAAEHIAATPVGMTVRCESELTAVEGRKLVFTLQAYDASGLVGNATHERFIVDSKRFMEKAKAKRSLEA